MVPTIEVLLTKLKHYGIRGVAFDWFSSYLHNRYQQVVCNRIASKFRTVKFGVPHPSILGPLLFLIYINDLPNTSSVLHYILFADDSNIFLSGANLEKLIELANTELKIASDWFKANKLSLNLNKTNYIIFRSTNKQISSTTKEINIDNVIIPRVASTKFLGVYVDQHLKWNIHIEEISKKISKNIGIIKRISHLLPKQTLKLLYHALIHPYLTYCNCIWSSTYITHLTQLTTLQKKLYVS